jgi:hypothetical protein
MAGRVEVTRRNGSNNDIVSFRLKVEIGVLPHNGCRSGTSVALRRQFKYEIQIKRPVEELVGLLEMVEAISLRYSNRSVSNHGPAFIVVEAQQSAAVRTYRYG